MKAESRMTASLDQESGEKTAFPPVAQSPAIPAIPATPATPATPAADRNQNTDQNQTKDKTLKSSETKLDQAVAAAICGLTAAFVAFIFGLVTEYIPRVIDNLLLSILVGLCAGVIAYALITNDGRQ